MLFLQFFVVVVVVVVVVATAVVVVVVVVCVCVCVMCKRTPKRSLINFFLFNSFPARVRGFSKTIDTKLSHNVEE